MLPKPYGTGVYKARRLCSYWRLCGRLCATNRLCGSCGHRIGSAALLAALHTPVTPSSYGARRPRVLIVSTRPRATRADIGRRLAGGSPRARRRKMGVDRRRGWCYCDGQSRPKEGAKPMTGPAQYDPQFQQIAPKVLARSLGRDVSLSSGAFVQPAAGGEIRRRLIVFPGGRP